MISSNKNLLTKHNDIRLAKKLKLFDYFSIGFGSIIGVGWVIMVGDWISMGGGFFSTIFAFIIGAFILIPIALAYGDLAVDMPVAGGAVAYSLNAFGALSSFFTGWFLALGYITMCPWETIAIGQILEALFPCLKTYPLYSMGEYILYAPILLISLSISVFIIIVNYKSIEYVTKVQNFLTISLFLIAVISIIASLCSGSIDNLKPFISNTSKNPTGSFLIGFFSVLAITPFFYSGFDTIPQGIEEHSENTNSKAICKTIILSIIAACLFYVLVIFAVSIIMPWKEILKMNIPASDVFMQGLSSPIIAKLILIGALCGLITTLNSFYVAGARVLLSLGRAKFINETFSKIHPVYKTPYISNSVIAVITLLGPFLGRQLLLPITNVCSFGFMVSWLMVCLSSIKLSARTQSKNKIIKVINKKILSVVFSVLMLIILILPSSPGSLNWPTEWGLVMIWLLIGLVFYFTSNSKDKKISKEERRRSVLGDLYKDN